MSRIETGIGIDEILSIPNLNYVMQNICGLIGGRL